MFDPKLFYKTYQVNYYDYIQYTNQKLLESYDSSYLKDIIHGYNREDFELAIKSSIRQTYFHSIETLFELIFALCPNENGKIFDDKILLTITKSEFPYNKIARIAADINELEILDSELELTHRRVSLGHYIFYNCIDKEELQVRIKDSISAIKYGLHLMAKDFADRKEYNSYKHGLRLIPALKSLSLLNAEKPTDKIEFDLKNTVSFYSIIKDDEIEITTKVLDYKRDIKMTSLVSNLLYNIIGIRRAFLYKETDDLPIFFYGKENIDDTAKPETLGITTLKFKSKVK